ncbi:hemolysin [Brevundimonas sp.]|uniref:hemolysin n=1 Tax=Brevundimonas sp. TaxID=1871086 RepID=UPI002D68AEF6|nr:hemolysin [Brevundimonas sp.]HYC98647.1 hemolysin [Brevundimonas sp.]
MKIPLLSLAAAGLLAAACAPIEPVPPDGGPSQCRADQYQRFIGRNRSELPAKPANETWRVTCTTCPVTMDYSPSRLNILYAQSTGIIREVKCG